MFNKKFAAEMVGTFIFSLGINISTQYTSDSQLPNLFSIISCLFCAITLTRNISGGHINGAVTFGFALDEMNGHKNVPGQGLITPTINFIFYGVYQVAGAMVACTLSFIFYEGHILNFSKQSYTTFGILFAEAVATFIFVFNILTQSENRFSKNSSISTLLIVLGLFAAVNITSVLSSGCVNPSLAAGHFLTRFLFGQADGWEFYQTFLYILGELGGSFVAAILYNKYFREEVDIDNKSQTETLN